MGLLWVNEEKHQGIFLHETSSHAILTPSQWLLAIHDSLQSETIQHRRTILSPAFVRFYFNTYLWFTSEHRGVIALSQRRFRQQKSDRTAVHTGSFFFWGLIMGWQTATWCITASSWVWSTDEMRWDEIKWDEIKKKKKNYLKIHQCKNVIIFATDYFDSTRGIKEFSNV